MSFARSVSMPALAAPAAVAATAALVPPENTASLPSLTTMGATATIMEGAEAPASLGQVHLDV